MFAVTRPKDADENDPDSVVRYFIAGGSYLRKNGIVVLDSLSKVNAVFVPGRQTQVQLEGQPVTNVFLRAAAKPDAVVLNGRSVKVLYDETAHTVHIVICQI